MKFLVAFMCVIVAIISYVLSQHIYFSELLLIIFEMHRKKEENQLQSTVVRGSTVMDVVVRLVFHIIDIVVVSTGGKRGTGIRNDQI